MPVTHHPRLWARSFYEVASSPQGAITHTQATPQTQLPKEPSASLWDVLHHSALQQKQSTQPSVFASTLGSKGMTDEEWGVKGRETPFTHLDVPLKVKEVDSLPVAAVQCENIPGLRAGRKKQTIRVKFFLRCTTYTHVKHTDKHVQSRAHTHTHTRLMNTDSPVRPGHSDRVSPHPERRRFWKTDRDGFRDPDPRCQKLPLYIKLCPQLSPAPASIHSTGVWVNQLILSLTVSSRCVYSVGRVVMFTQSGVLVRKTRNQRLQKQSWKLTISCLNAAKIVLGLKLGSSAACQPHKSGCWTWPSSTESAAAAQTVRLARPRHELSPSFSVCSGAL